MGTQIFDDGSSITTDDAGSVIAATDSAGVFVPVNRPSASWDPASVNPAAGSWGDVLKFGIARVVDAKTRPVRPENASPVYARSYAPGVYGGQPAVFGGGGDQSWLIWLLILGGLAFAAMSGSKS